MLKHKMIGGFVSFYHLLPFLIEIVVFTDKHEIRGFTCSGSLVSYDWILTAAHCSLKPEKNYYLGAGFTDKSMNRRLKAMKFHYGQTRRVKLIIIHEQYNNRTHFNDIALMKARVPFKEKPNVSLVPLPLKEDIEDLSKMFNRCYIGGWGRTGANNILKFDQKTKNWTFNNDEKRSVNVAYLVLPLIPNDQCKRLWQRDILLSFNNVADTQICTLYYPGRKANCKGDSGGPLICGSKQYGIVSYSHSCGKPRFGADVYTRVDKYLNWINHTINRIRVHEKNVSTKKNNIILNLDYYDDNRGTKFHVFPDFIIIFVFNYVIYCVLKYF